MRRATLIGATLVASWLGMQGVHELGHIIGAWVTGGIVERVVLHPLAISRTDLGSNPQPLLVVWAGPVIGILVPLITWGCAWAAKWRSAFLLRFFAGFCLIANGLYIGLGALGAIGDCGEMLSHGSALWHLWLFGAVATPVGLWLWHGQGKHFGLGKDAEPVAPQLAYGVLAAAALLALVGLFFPD